LGRFKLLVSLDQQFQRAAYHFQLN
jgi:hypothetical protein